MAQNGSIRHEGQDAWAAWMAGRWADAFASLPSSGRAREILGALLRTETSDPRNVELDAVSVDASFSTATDWLSAVGFRVQGRIAAAQGDGERAFGQWRHAIALAREAAEPEEQCWAHLDWASALIRRDGPADMSAAVDHLHQARALAAEELSPELPGHQPIARELSVLLCLARARSGDLEGAIEELDLLLPDLADAPAALAKGLLAMAELQQERGASARAQEMERRAVEALEQVALALPRQERQSFWDAPERGRLLRRVRTPRPDAQPHSRTLRIIELTKRLASEHDQERLLERITDAAVELAGAERGFVLLPGEDGTLEPKLIRATSADDPSVAFSQSIAEAVWIDGEPLLTVDARDDRRLNEYMSVHKLMLRSVACLPIRAREGTLGVLYLEHRLRTGRFREDDLEVLMAFADLVAIALSNARLVAELEAREQEVRLAKEQVELAKAEVERVLVARTDELVAVREELTNARQSLRGRYEREGIVGQSEAMRAVFSVLDRVCQRNVPVVIQGESGTGKELVARAIHYMGARAKAPFVALNCGAIPEPLLESELFGHVRGAFTGAARSRRGLIERAHGGTLFLDEVGDMPAKMQVDLLRVLQDGVVRPVGGQPSDEIQVDVRIVSASNKSLPALVEEGVFREDLYYRLHVVGLRLPPLRERLGDLPILVNLFLRRISEQEGSPRKRISQAALACLATHPLPGNVRQLEHLLINACVMVEGDTIEPGDLALDGHLGARPVPNPVESPTPPVVQSHNLDGFKGAERDRILGALERHGWNRAKAARELDMPRRTFYRRLKEYEILE